jgi:hypothetical protein
MTSMISGWIFATAGERPPGRAGPSISKVTVNFDIEDVNIVYTLDIDVLQLRIRLSTSISKVKIQLEGHRYQSFKTSISDKHMSISKVGSA